MLLGHFGLVVTVIAGESSETATMAIVARAGAAMVHGEGMLPVEAGRQPARCSVAAGAVGAEQAGMFGRFAVAC